MTAAARFLARWGFPLVLVATFVVSFYYPSWAALIAAAASGWSLRGIYEILRRR